MDNFNPIPVTDMIHKAKGYVWGGDASAVNAAFAMIDTKSELLLVSTLFKSLYKVDLFSYLDWMTPAEKSDLQNIISKITKS